MISILQTRRPMISQYQVSPPLNQQPKRPMSLSAQSQVETMPQDLAQPGRMRPPLYDPASQHPVFFTSRMVKLPNGVVGAGASPVALGYQFEEGGKGSSPGGREKL